MSAMGTHSFGDARCSDSDASSERHADRCPHSIAELALLSGIRHEYEKWNKLRPGDALDGPFLLGLGG